MSQRDARLIGGVYRLGQAITEGGILRTYTAYNHNTNDIVGLVVLDIPASAQSEDMSHLTRSLEKRQQVQSPHVLQILDWGLEASKLYIATEAPRGITLQHVLDNENIDILRAMELSRQLATGLKAMHEHGVTGIDLRPQLITVDTMGITDRVQLDDLGLRDLLQKVQYVSNQRHNDIGFLDPRYASPETINGLPGGIPSDMYQLGLLIFNLITGRLPFVGRTPAETGILQSTSPVPQMKRYQHNTPEAVQDIVQHLLAKDPQQRFSNAGALLTALNTLQITPLNTQSAPMVAIKNIETLTSEFSSHGMTNEMGKISEDISLLSTIIEGKTPINITNVPSPSGVYAYLLYEPKGEEQQRIAIRQKSVIVGREDPKRRVSPDIDLSPFDTNMTISRQHARIQFEGAFFYIEDLKSRNKTRLGELVLTPLKPVMLQHGDILAFGSVRLRFELAGDKSLPPEK